VIEGGTEMGTDGVCLTLEGTECFIHDLSEADWFTATRDSSAQKRGTLGRRRACHL
jgi:hypothetical protein